MAKDPVCGMYVDPKKAAGSSLYKGEAIYFCNPRCKERFDAEPEKFIGVSAGLRFFARHMTEKRRCGAAC